MKKILSFLFCMFCAVSNADDFGIKIDSKEMTLETFNNVASYHGDVKMLSGKYSVNCNDVNIFFSKSKHQNDTDSIERITFEGDVIFAGDGRIVNSKNAEYIANQRKIYFLGNVKVKDQAGYLEGEKIEYDLNKEIVKIVGERKEDKNKKDRVRIIIEDESNEVSKS